MDFVDFLHIFVPIFAVIDPFAALPLYLSFSHGLSKDDKNRIIKESTITAVSLLLFFQFTGMYILDFFGISIAALMIAGGVLMILVGIEMVREGDKPRSTRKKDKLVEETGDVAIVPLGTPMLAGPGAISLAIILMGKYGSSPVGIVSITISIISVIAITAIFFMGGNYVSKIMGEKGSKAFTRVMGLLVTAFAVQYILDGISMYFHL